MTIDSVSLCAQSPVGPMGQFLYSVYVHSGPDYPGYKEKSLFYGREVPDRVQVRKACVQHYLTASPGLLAEAVSMSHAGSLCSKDRCVGNKIVCVPMRSTVRCLSL